MDNPTASLSHQGGWGSCLQCAPEQPLLLPGDSELGQALLSYPPCPFGHMGNKISFRGSFACLHWRGFPLGSVGGAELPGGALDETLREALLQERRSNMTFPNSTSTQFLLGARTMCHPHATVQEQSCPMMWTRDPAESASTVLAVAWPHFSAAPTLLRGWTMIVLQH